MFHMGTGETVFYFASAERDAYTPLPTFLLAESPALIGPHWRAPLAPGRLAQARAHTPVPPSLPTHPPIHPPTHPPIHPPIYLPHPGVD